MSDIAQNCEALHAAYESAQDRLGGMSFDHFCESTRAFEVHPQYVDGRIAGAILVNGKEAHACILPWAHKRWFGRKAIRLMNSIIDKHQEITTHAETEAGRRFVGKLGFTFDGDKFRRTEKWALKQ